MVAGLAKNMTLYNLRRSVDDDALLDAVQCDDDHHLWQIMSIHRCGFHIKNKSDWVYFMSRYANTLSRKLTRKLLALSRYVEKHKIARETFYTRRRDGDQPVAAARGSACKRQSGGRHDAASHHHP